jgi:hypothetical protein
MQTVMNEYCKRGIEQGHNDVADDHKSNIRDLLLQDHMVYIDLLIALTGNG